MVSTLEPPDELEPEPEPEPELEPWPESSGSSVVVSTYESSLVAFSFESSL